MDHSPVEFIDSKMYELEIKCNFYKIQSVTPNSKGFGVFTS